MSGCSRTHESPVAGPTADVDVEAETTAAPHAITINSGWVGAEGSAAVAEPTPAARPNRQFAFLVTGIGTEPKSGGAVERKAAALEAAVVDAIGRATREILRDPKTGRAPIEYKAALGPGLTVFGQLVSGAPRTVILFDRRGRIDELCAADGVLAHPPHDGRIIQRIFAAAQGKLVLQATRAGHKPGYHAADVAYYRKVGSEATNPADRELPRQPIIATGR